MCTSLATKIVNNVLICFALTDCILVIMMLGLGAAGGWSAVTGPLSS